MGRKRRRRGRAFPALSQLAISDAHAVHSLRVREALAVGGLKLVDQTGPGEVPTAGTTWQPQPPRRSSWHGRG